MIRLGSLWYNCNYWSRFETLSCYKSSAIPHLVIIRLSCMKANSYSNFVMPSYSQLTRVKFPAATMRHAPHMPNVKSPLRLILLPLNRVSRHLSSVCPSVAKFISSTPTRATHLFLLSWTLYEDTRMSRRNIFTHSLYPALP